MSQQREMTVKAWREGVQRLFLVETKEKTLSLSSQLLTKEKGGLSAGKVADQRGVIRQLDVGNREIVYPDAP